MYSGTQLIDIERLSFETILAHFSTTNSDRFLDEATTFAECEALQASGQFIILFENINNIADFAKSCFESDDYRLKFFILLSLEFVEGQLLTARSLCTILGSLQSGSRIKFIHMLSEETRHRVVNTAQSKEMIMKLLTVPQRAALDLLPQESKAAMPITAIIITSSGKSPITNHQADNR